jgi:hypothetical protein
MAFLPITLEWKGAIRDCSPDRSNHSSHLSSLIVIKEQVRNKEKERPENKIGPSNKVDKSHTTFDFHQFCVKNKIKFVKQANKTIKGQIKSSYLLHATCRLSLEYQNGRLQLSSQAWTQRQKTYSAILSCLALAP